MSDTALARRSGGAHLQGADEGTRPRQDEAEPEAQEPPRQLSPTQSTPNHRPLYVALGVLAAAALAGLVLLLLRDDPVPDGTPAAAQGTAPSAPGTTPTEGTGSVNGADGTDAAATTTVGGCAIPEPRLDPDLVVVDCGFSTVDVDGRRAPSVGVVVENQSDAFVQEVELTVDLLDEDGQVLGSSDALTYYLVPPSGQAAFGYSDGFADYADDVAGVAISFSRDREPAWSPPEGGELTVTSVDTAVEELGSGVTEHRTEVTVESTYEVTAYNPTAYLIFRDAGGEIVGGARAPFEADSILAPGTTTVRTAPYVLVPEDFDAGGVEVFVDIRTTYEDLFGTYDLVGPDETAGN